jgi:hypothetical protein
MRSMDGIHRAMAAFAQHMVTRDLICLVSKLSRQRKTPPAH